MAGWTSKPIGDVFKVVNGGTPKTGVASNWDGPHAWITPAEMGNLDTPYISESRRTLTDEGLRTGAELVPAGSIILSSRAPIGHLVINEIPMAFNQGCKGLIPSPAIDTKYAYYFLLTNVPLLESLGIGATFKELSGGKLKEVPFHFPDLGEQRRIVTLLDEAFADIATAKTNVEKNLQNAEVLFQSQLQSLFNRPTSSKVQITLGKATGGVFTGPFGSLLHKHDYVENGIPLVNPAHISPFGIEPDYRKTVSNETAERLASYIMRAGDIVIGRRGEMGRCALITDVEDGWLCGTGSFFIKPSNQCDAAYLVHLLRSEGCKQQLEKIAGGAVMPNLSNTDLSNFVLELPPVEEQKQIVDQIELAKQDVERLKAIYRQKLTALDDLKKSLLHQAFSGQL